MSYELYIFGSAVRGDVSSTSDVDVLAIPADLSAGSFPHAWSVYTRDTILKYHAEGRLFAWHLYLEARRVYPDTGTPLLTVLGEPAPYATGATDIADLQTILTEAIDQLQRGTRSSVYELGIVYTALRDIAMSASWSLLGAPCFARHSPFMLPSPCPLSRHAYDAAMAARHESTRGFPARLDLPAVTKAVLGAPLLEWVQQLRRQTCPTHS